MAASNTTGIDEVTKFPRTRHLFAVGKGVSRDDLLMDKSEEDIFYTTPMNNNTARLVSIEEKVNNNNNKQDLSGSVLPTNLKKFINLIKPNIARGAV